MKPSALLSNKCEAALRRAIIYAIPEYFAWPETKQEDYRLNVSRETNFRIQQSLLKSLFNINTDSEEQLDAALNEFDDEQYLLLNSTLLPFQGIGKNNFFLNEYLAEGVTLLDFPTPGDYARYDHHFQQQARKQEDPTYEIQIYRGDLFPTWARLTIDGDFSYATLFSLAARLRDVIDETGTDRINQLIPHDYIEGKNHGKQERQGTILDLQVDAAGKEPQLDELQHRFYQYMHTRYEHLLERFDKEAKKCVYIQRIAQDQEPHINFIFSDKSAFDAVHFRDFYNDCEHIAGDIIELDALTKQEQTASIKFLDTNYREIIDNYDPSVVRFRKKRTIILADGALDDLL